jgi:nitrite reductase/ring-hydroxylating ferredoxin subunit
MDTTQARRYDVGGSDHVPESGRLVVEAGGTVVGVFRLGGLLYAYENTCAHQGGPVCQGKILPRVTENLADDKTSQGLYFVETDMHIICPWHGYEYSISTGRHAGDDRIGLTKIAVSEENGRIYLSV